MKFSLSKQDTLKLKSLFEINDININIGDMLFYAFQNSINFKDVSSLKEYKESLFDLWEIANNEENSTLFDSHVNLKEIDDSLLINNEYYKTIGLISFKEGQYELFSDHYKAYELFANNDIEIDKNFNEISNVAYFSKEVPFLALNKNKETWMSITPSEINSMKDAIAKAHGHVLVGGLGLGYFPFMISLKENVNKITIIESDKEIISIFKKFLLPKFPDKEKIEIISDDLFNYVKNRPGKFDFAFIDLWHSPSDGLELYIKCKQHEKYMPNTEFTYWIETSLLAMFRRAVLTLIQEQFNGSTEKDYIKAECFFDKLINKLFIVFKQKNIASFDEVINILSDINLLAIIKRIF